MHPHPQPLSQEERGAAAFPPLSLGEGRGEGSEVFIPSTLESKIIGKKIQKICTNFLGISRTEEGIAEGKKQLRNLLNNSEFSKNPEKFLGTREKNMKILVEKIFDDILDV